MLKNRKFWLCALLFAGLLGLAAGFEHIDQYHPFPYIMMFHALTLFSWLSGLYHRWKPGDGRAWGVLVLLFALPQIFMCMVSYVSWVCLGVSLVLGAGAILKGEKAA